MEYLLEARLLENEVLIISSVENKDKPQAILDTMMGIVRPGCYNEYTMVLETAAGPGSSALSHHIALSSTSYVCHCSSSELCCTHNSTIDVSSSTSPSRKDRNSR